MKFVPPSISETAFNCPHCGALAKQYWHSVRADSLEEKNPIPVVFTEGTDFNQKFKDIKNDAARANVIEWAEELASGRPIYKSGEGGSHFFYNIYNLFISRCFNCDGLSIWIHNKLVYPTKGEAPPANPDMSPNIRRDYEEASAILDHSPRGAAALLRLSIQKLCIELGQPGKNINDDIKALVEAGLSQRVQMALDALRVIGNNAVHPGQIDLWDDRATAESLFRLLCPSSN